MPSAADSSWDVIVAGLGAVGSAALAQLSARGARVLGLDRFHPPHDRGSSHGETRITRLALGEGEQYVQFARRSHEHWRLLEEATGRSLLHTVGGLIYGSPSRCAGAHGAEDFLQTTIDVARRHAIPHDVLDAAALAERFPQFRYRGDEMGCFEHGAGYLRPEECIAAQLEVARQRGVSIQTGEQITSWTLSGEGIRVITDQGSYEASRLILTAGAWLPGLVAGMRSAAQVYRQVLYWFETEGPPDLFAPHRMPIFIRVPDQSAAMFYGFPAINGPDGGLKIAGEQFDRTSLPDEVSEVSEEEIHAMHALASPHLRITGRCKRTVVCKYTVTPDFHFVIDHLPDTDKVWFASACSGHGFKHSAAVGEALAEMALEGKTQFDLTSFKLQRILQQQSSARV